MTFFFNGGSDSFNSSIGGNEDDLWMFAAKKPSANSILDAIQASTNMSEASLYYAKIAINKVKLSNQEVVRLESAARGKASKFAISQGWGDGGFVKLSDLFKNKRMGLEKAA